MRQKGFIPPSLLDSTIKLFTAISRRLRSPEGLWNAPIREPAERRVMQLSGRQVLFVLLMDVGPINNYLIELLLM